MANAFFKNLGHAVASTFTKVVNEEKAVIVALNKFSGSEKSVEGVTALLPYGGIGVTVERLAYGAIGSLAAAITSQPKSVAQLANAGVDAQFLAEVEAFVKAAPDLIKQAQVAFKSATPFNAAQAEALLNNAPTVVATLAGQAAAL